ncbi:uncharacterized protein LOC116241682, partial [Phasianus colchicus]|uniref:uncharacterized protein LOC116241682 n=1 Tax=Phasianus colchicus TaxID=9054 RepID=UPI00129DF8A4
MAPYGVSVGSQWVPMEFLWGFNGVSMAPYEVSVGSQWVPMGFLWGLNGSLWGFCGVSMAPYGVSMGVPPSNPPPRPPKGAEARLDSDLQSARRMGAPYGLKLVRGAYLQHERLTGALQPSREHTDRSYAACLELALQHVSAGHVALVVATHNADSVRHAARRMEELRIPREGPVCFAQLQGVAEHLGLALGERRGFGTIGANGGEARLFFREGRGGVGAPRRHFGANSGDFGVFLCPFWGKFWRFGVFCAHFGANSPNFGALVPNFGA